MSHNIDGRRLSNSDRLAISKIRKHPMVKKEIVLEGKPELRHTAGGLAVCKLYVGGVYYVTFAAMAKSVAQQVKVGDKLRVYGNYKPYSWRDVDGHVHTREDFMVKRWEILHA